MKKQRNCKICQSYQSTPLLALYHVHKFTYKQIIAYFAKRGLFLNLFNINCHLHRHVEQSDIEYVEKYTIIRENEVKTELANMV
jgi:hypothetical protein